MGHTMVEKVLASHCGRRELFPGEIIDADVDLLMMNELSASLAIEGFETLGFDKVFDPDRIIVIPDHNVPCKDIKAAEMVKLASNFCRKQGVKNFFSLGRMGIEHALVAEKGYVYPGQLYIGGDSHTSTAGAVGSVGFGMGSTDCAGILASGRTWLRVPATQRFVYYGRPKKWVSGKDIILHTINQIGVDGANYAAMEFAGEAIQALSMDERFTMTNMAAEAGAKTGYMEPDAATLDYLQGRVRGDFTVVKSDPDAQYDRVLEIDVSRIEPLVACPFLPSNVKNAMDLGNITIDQVVIGSCTNGRISDLRVAASILKGKKVHPEVRLLFFPASQDIYMQALKEGLIEIFVEAEAVVSTPSCGPCLGGHLGVIGHGERAISTTNRNFKGRMGPSDSEVYLSGPAVAAASAIIGRIGTPEEVM
jgi:3-isopropylmalate/(R)-2-methylmalate dehydratase large subunit